MLLQGHSNSTELQNARHIYTCVCVSVSVSFRCVCMYTIACFCGWELGGVSVCLSVRVSLPVCVCVLQGFSDRLTLTAVSFAFTSLAKYRTQWSPVYIGMHTLMSRGQELQNEEGYLCVCVCERERERERGCYDCFTCDCVHVFGLAL